MLTHLSATSPYVCDISLGPIEQANRMASAPTKTPVSLLEYKESFPKFQQTRTPLKLLAPDEVPMDTSTATTTTTDMNNSRQQSLQPVWYTEQTIVDDNNDHQQQQQRNSMISPNHRHDLTRSTLPTIESYSPEIVDEIIEQEPLSYKPSLMRKSSTFTIERQSTINIPSTLNDSEKENDFNNIITSTQEEPKHPINHPTEPSDESFRALEHLLGLGSVNTNLTMTALAQESPKSNHESLSLTIVTPTELINQTGTSFLSYAPAGGSLPSSQNILVMPTIESITEPSMNSTIPPPFAVDNSDTEEASSPGGTILNQENSKCTEDSFNFTDNDDDEPLETPKDDTNSEEDNNFSFELNDFPNNSKDTTNESSYLAPIPPPPIITIRQPTSADVAYRALIKSRLGGRISQPVKTESPLAKSSKDKVTVRSSVPIPSPTPTSRVLRSSTRRISIDPVSENSTTEEINEPIDLVSESSTTTEEINEPIDLVSDNSTPEEINKPNPSVENEYFENENKIDDDDYPRIELVEVVSLTDEDEIEQEQMAGITLNLTETKEINSTSPTSAEEADCSASFSSSHISPQQDINTPIDTKMPVLSREFTYNTPTSRTTRSSQQRRSIITNYQNYSRSAHSLITTIPEQQTTASSEEEDQQQLSTYSIPLSTLSTNPTVISEAPTIILQKSLAGSASPSPNPTPIITIRQSQRLSSNLSPRRNINPLHSSTPSARNKSLQMVSIGEQEQVSTTAPPHLNIDLTTDDVEMLDNEQQIDIPIKIQHVTDEGIQTSPIQSPRRVDIGIQTTPSLNPLSYRRYQTIEQQTTPIITRSSSSSSCQTTSIAIAIQQTSPIIETRSKIIIQEEKEEEEEQQQGTPLHSKAIMHLRRNVRFQFTPSTDARLTAKEKLEEEQKKHVKQDIIIDNTKSILSDNEREEDTEDEIRKTKKKITTSKKKKIVPTTKTDDSSEEMNESPVRRITRNQRHKTTDDTHETSTTQSKKKTSKRSISNEKKSSPIKELPIIQPDIIVIPTSPVLTTKRAARKRPNPKTSTVSPPEPTSPTEPVMKRAKTSKHVEIKQSVRVPSPEPPSTRGRSKTTIISTSPVDMTERLPPPLPPTTVNTSKKVKKTSLETSPVEIPAVPINNKRKNTMPTNRKGKRRLHSVEQDEGLNTADEEETIQTMLPIVEEIIPMDLSQEEREKIEGLTVIELKNRLTTHNETLPKGARKADLVALLIKIETNLLKEKKEAEIISTKSIPANLSSRKTRQKK
ncbi:unnamed protein product [Adineta steineri]|uniref:Uncharacterized protein n=1 Tax=Adineta steineri TaxID=433720 RepID=A0A818SY69_9BILA|nr:unnamed protein product [Adineta steineri]CAF3674193.1 unnamed protein product [Adineta steineri]